MSASANWISLGELLQLTGWDDRTVRRKQSAGLLITRPGVISRNGKVQREYDFSSLPSEFQTKHLSQNSSLALTVPEKKTAVPHPSRTIATLAGEELHQAKERLEIIRPMIDFANSGQQPLYPDGHVTNLRGIAQRIASANRQSERTIWNWWRTWKQRGPGELADRPRKDRNISRFFKDHSEAAQFVMNKFLNERLSMTMVYEALVREWSRLQLNSEDIPPTYKTTRLFLNSLPPIVAAVAHYGERAYKEDFAPFIIRDRSKLTANQYWVSDHMQHDVFVRNVNTETGAPVFGELPLNAAFRPWLTAIEDMKSRRIIGMVWCATPSSNTISSALRFALEHYGRPTKAFYVDNGKDYNKVSDDARGVLCRLQITTQHCIPRHPQAKQIESFFHILHQRFDVLWRPAYAGTSPKTRPEECDKLLHDHKKLITAGKGDKSSLPSASDFIQLAASWLDDWNNTFKDQARGMGKRTPAEIFDADLPPEKRTVVNTMDIAQLFWDRQKRVVREGGTVQLYNSRYEPADQDSTAALMLNVQREVLVACDPLSVGNAIALTLDGQFLGVMRAQELLVHGETSQDEIRASMRDRKNIYKAIKHHIAKLAQSRVAAGDISELDLLARRAVGAPSPTIYALPVPKAINAPETKRWHADDIADSYEEED